MKNEKWIEDAFKEALQVDGKPVSGFAREQMLKFSFAMPGIIDSYAESFGKQRAVEIMFEIVKSNHLMQFIQCVFTAGYVFKMKEAEQEEGKTEE